MFSLYSEMRYASRICTQKWFTCVSYTSGVETFLTATLSPYDRSRTSSCFSVALTQSCSHGTAPRKNNECGNCDTKFSHGTAPRKNNKLSAATANLAQGILNANTKQLVMDKRTFWASFVAIKAGLSGMGTLEDCHFRTCGRDEQEECRCLCPGGIDNACLQFGLLFHSGAMQTLELRRKNAMCPLKKLASQILDSNYDSIGRKASSASPGANPSIIFSKKT